ncbi:sensor histidine kinase [Alteromonas sp. ALT199]|uniref:sensor histidine kinase n=1 Tax=unclassified Alteromonas TaxID=2614992 RepID=UPI001BEA1B24|nr:sensor histidine kinase [Alteromonas sp. ALT199]MBT3134634.1 sensor histidine kinase [Alteromonas sp. ALT199]
MELILSLLQQMCVYLVLAYLLSKTPLFLPILSISSHRKHRYLVYVVFSSFCILGTYFGLQIDDAIANTRAIGAVIGGLLGGPEVGFAVGLTGGLHRYSLGGFTDVACAISTTLEGLIGGVMHVYYVRRNKRLALFNPFKVGAITFVAELFQMAILLTVATPFEKSYALVSAIAAPMIIANSVGAALFISILSDKKTIFEKYSATFSRRALSIADRSVGLLTTGFNRVNAEKIARIVYEETNVGAVAITDTEKILAFIGKGDDHHLPDTLISSASTMESINNNKIVHLDGAERLYQCTLDEYCPLGSVLIIPLHSGTEVVGTIKLYEPKRKLMSTVTLSMAEGIAQLLSSQIVYGAYQQQKDLLSQSEIKLLHAQVNPHFLFNALNTISAIVRRDPKSARDLVLSLSRFFRSNLKQNTAVVTFKEELDHVNAYLAIEKARFAERLNVIIEYDNDTLTTLLPSFTLQPLVENAVKHGIAQRIEGGTLLIKASCTNENKLCVRVEDNAGLFKHKAEKHTGLGMDIVDKRLVHQFGAQSGLVIECNPLQFTRMSFTIPITNQSEK